MDKKDLEALYKIHGGKEKYERWAKRRLEYYSKEDAELEDQFLLALFRDKDTKKAEEIALKVKKASLKKDLLTEIKAYKQACIVG
jgi:hypothetical protein